MLEVRRVAAGYDSEPVIHDITMTVDAGEIVALIGANGAGKSTLAKTLSGILRSLSGEIWFQGEAITNVSPARRIQRGIVQVPEGRQIFASLTVKQNLELGAFSRSMSAADFNRRSHDLQQRFPILAERYNAVAGNLSGGQQQLLAIARAMMAIPKLLILDEPSLGLSPAMTKEIFSLIAELRREGLSVLISEQNARASLAIADRGYVIENGHITASDTAPALAASGEIARRYLGAGCTIPEKTVDAEFKQRLTEALR